MCEQDSCPKWCFTVTYWDIKQITVETVTICSLCWEEENLAYVSAVA